MIHNRKIKLIAFTGIGLSVVSLLVHLIVANYSTGRLSNSEFNVNGFYASGPKPRLRRLWGPLSSLEALHPYDTPRNQYPDPNGKNGYIYAKIYGGFEKIQSAISDIVAVVRILNATLVIPELQATTRAKGISTKFRSFTYLYDEDHFISTLLSDVIIVKSLPTYLKEARKKTKFPTVSPNSSTSPDFYVSEVLPKLLKSKVIGLIITNGGCLESILPISMDEVQRLRCRVAFQALQLRQEIRALGDQMTERLRATGRPYLAYHPGLIKSTLAFHGCAELFQDVHTELIQYSRKQLINRGILMDELNVDSVARKKNGSCPLMPEEVGLLLQALGYPSNTIIYLAGSETFGGQRILIPLRAMYANLVDRTSLCSKQELLYLVGPETPLLSNLPNPPPVKSEKELLNDWKRAGPRPRPLPPPPARPFYPHEKEGWYGWVAETDTEPEPSLSDLRMRAHRLLWDALDYYVSVEADAFLPGFHNDGGDWPDYSSLVMGHRLYKTPSSVTYRPNRKILVEMFANVSDTLYHPPRNWTLSVRQLLNKSLGIDGILEDAGDLKRRSFIAHPLPECACRSSEHSGFAVKDGKLRVLVGDEEKCPDWTVRGVAKASKAHADIGNILENEDYENVLLENDSGTEGKPYSDRADASKSLEHDEEMDPDD